MGIAETLIEQVKLIGSAAVIGMILFGLTLAGLGSWRGRRR